MTVISPATISAIQGGAAVAASRSGRNSGEKEEVCTMDLRLIYLAVGLVVALILVVLTP